MTTEENRCVGPLIERKIQRNVHKISGIGWSLEEAVKRREQGGFCGTIKKRVFLDTFTRARAREGERRLLTNVDIKEALYAPVREGE